MNCTRFEEVLTAALEARETSLPEEVHAHAEACLGCRETLGDHELLERAIVRWRQQVPAVRLTERILSALAADRESSSASLRANSTAERPVASRQARLNRQAWGVVAAAAASLLFLLWPMHPWSTRDPELALHETSAPLPAHSDPLDSSPEIDFLVRDAAVYLSLADANLAGIERVTALFPPSPSVSLPGFESDEVPLPAVPVGEWRDGLKPLGDGIGKAFGFLRHAIPETEPSTT